MSEQEVEVVVRVRVLASETESQRVAVDMVKDALASRPAHWTRSTFVSEGDVHAV